MKLDPFAVERLKRGLITLGVAMLLIALVILLHELKEAMVLRDMKAGHDAKQYAGSDMISSGENVWTTSEPLVRVPWGWGNSGELRPEYALED